jgi:V/A-type H+-transporting ATPase subunit C
LEEGERVIRAETRELLESKRRIRITLSPYTYVRTVVMASQLFDKDTYARLTRLALPEIVQFLEETTYKREIDELAASESGVALVEHAIHRNFWRSVEKIRAISDENVRFLIDVYVWRNDIENIKTIVRAKRRGETYERIRTLLFPGTFTKDELAELYRGANVEEILAHLDLPFVTNAVQTYTERGLAGVETMMTHGYYSLTHRVARRIPDERDLFREFLLLEIDIVNIMTVLKLKRHGEKPDTILAALIDAYGDLPRTVQTIQHRARKELYTRLAVAGDVDECLNILAETRFKTLLASGTEAYRTTGSLLELERQTRAALLRKAMMHGHIQPQSSDVVVSYLFAKVTEARNILLIVKGKELGMDNRLLEEELVVR